MKILVTAGATQTPIDKVRAITNIFKGRTGSAIARYIYSHSGVHSGAGVTLLTSNSLERELSQGYRVIKYRTYDELYARMEEEIRTGGYDAVIHSAAVSDYKVEGCYTCAQKETGDGYIEVALMEEDASGKVSGSHEELFLRLVPTEKIIDKIRAEWGFTGILVKFKLQVGISDDELLRIAAKSMADSQADMIVANCLEWCDRSAYILAKGEATVVVPRDLLPTDLVRRVYDLYVEKNRKVRV